MTRNGGGAAVKSRQFAIEFASDFPKPRLPRRCGTETTWVNLCEKLSSCLRVEGSLSFPYSLPEPRRNNGLTVPPGFLRPGGAISITVTRNVRCLCIITGSNLPRNRYHCFAGSREPGPRQREDGAAGFACLPTLWLMRATAGSWQQPCINLIIKR